MTLRAFKEITEWEVPTPNHTYILNDQGHLVGYIKTGTKDYIELSKPMKLFSKSRRKFVELKPVEKYIGATS